MMAKVIGLMFGLVCSGAVDAGWAQTAPVIGESPRFRVYCEAGPVCNDPQAPAFGQARVHGADITQMLEQIQDWFDQMRYPPSQLNREDGRWVVTYAQDGACGTNATACNRRFIRPAMYFIREQIMQGISNSATIAHEFSHSLHDITPAQPLRWLDEAISSAIGQEWGARSGQPFHVADPKFEFSLDVPFYAHPQEGYGQGDYMQFVGDQSASTPRLGYLRDFFMLPDDGQNGMTYLYRDALGAGSFDFAFPQYVARFNSVETFAEGGGKYYDAPVSVRIDVGAPDLIAKYAFDRTAQAFAADAVHLNDISVEEPRSGADRDALMVAEISLTEAERRDDLRLIYEHRRLTGHSVKFLIRAGQAMDLGFVRVTNAAHTAEATAPQGYKMNLELQPAAFLLPSCLETGESAAISVREGIFDDVGNFQIVPSAGTVKGLTFTAPAQAQTVSMRLRIRSTITRADHGIARTPRLDRIVDLGEVTVANSCMIQMGQFGGSNATYDAEHDYTGYDTAKGVMMFARPGEIAVYDSQKGGWVDIPPMAQAMLSGRMQSGGPFAKAFEPHVAGLNATPDILARMPLIMSQRFAWSRIAPIAKANHPDAPVSRPAPCPAGSEATGCHVIEHGEGGKKFAITYDGARKLVGLNLDGLQLIFRYGTFPLARPPGW